MTRAHVWYALLAILMSGVTMYGVGLVHGVLMPVGDMQITYQKLQRGGQLVEGLVSSIEPTSVFVNNQPVSRFVVQCHQSGVEKKVVFEQVVPMTALPRVQPGMHVPLRIDPTPGGPAMIDLQRLDSPRE